MANRSMDLDQVDKYFLLTSLLPSIVFLLISTIVGLIGNSIVLIVYKKDFMKKTTWLFVYLMAVLDFVFCLVSLPTDLAMLLNFTSMSSGSWCPISRYVYYFCNGTTSIILVVIALYRYVRVCKPGCQWFNMKNAKKTCIGVILFDLVINAPVLVLYEEVPLPILILNHTVKFMNSEEIKRYFLVSNTTVIDGNGTMAVSNKPQVIIGRICTANSENTGHVFMDLFYYFKFLSYVVFALLIFYFYYQIIRTLRVYGKRQKEIFRDHSKDRNPKIVVDQHDHEFSTNVDLLDKDDGITSQISFTPREERNSLILLYYNKFDHDSGDKNSHHTSAHEFDHDSGDKNSHHTSAHTAIEETEKEKKAEKNKETDEEMEMEKDRHGENETGRDKEQEKDNEPEKDNESEKDMETEKDRKTQRETETVRECKSERDHFSLLHVSENQEGNNLTPTSEISLALPSTQISTSTNNKLGHGHAAIPKGRSKRIKSIQALRKSIMLLSVSFAFIISFLPGGIAFVCIMAMGPDLLPSMSPVGLGMIYFAGFMILINNAVNPFLYAFFDNDFRKRCQILIRRN